MEGMKEAEQAGQALPRMAICQRLAQLGRNAGVDAVPSRSPI